MCIYINTEYWPKHFVKQYFLIYSVKLIGYCFSVVSIISFNPSVGLFPKIKISLLFLLLTCGEELIYATFLSNPLPLLDHERIP